MNIFEILCVSTPADFDKHRGLHSVYQLEGAVREWWALGKDGRKQAIESSNARGYRCCHGTAIGYCMRNKAQVVFHVSGCTFVNFNWGRSYVYKPWLKEFSKKGYCTDFYILENKSGR